MAVIRDPGASTLSPSAALTRFDFEEDSGPLQSRERQIQPIRYGFRLGPLGFLIARDIVSEVVHDSPDFAIPNTPTWLKGIINLRGNLVPIFELHNILAIDDSSMINPMYLVMDKGENALGIVVDGYPKTINTTNQLPNAPVPEQLKEFFRDAYLDEDEVWLDINIAAFVESLSQQFND